MDPDGSRQQGADSVDAEDVELPEDLVKDDADREMLLHMTELEREMELAERAEKQRRENERQTLLQSTEATGEVKTTYLGKRTAGAMEGHSDEELTFASQTGTPTALRGKLEEESSEKETDDSETEDREAVDNEAEFQDYLSAQIFRSDLERWISEPHFESSVLGCFVRLHGTESNKMEHNRNEYAMVEVIDCQSKEDTQSYEFGPLNKSIKVQLLLKRGGTEFWSGLNVISNSEFTIKEFEEWIQACKRHSRTLPSKAELEGRQNQIDQARKFVFTHAEVKKILEDKRKQGALKQSNVMQRAQLMRYRDHYLEMQDMFKVQEYEAKIKELEAKADAQRRSHASGVVDKQTAVREMHLKSEHYDNLLRRRRPRVMQKFERKLSKLPPERRPKAMMAFYGANHPLCSNIEAKDVEQRGLIDEKMPEPPAVPEDIVMPPDLERDLKTADDDGFKDRLVQFADRLSHQAIDRAICRRLLEKWNGPDDWETEIEKGVADGTVRVRSWTHRS